jgi:hypothetical protein
VRDLKIALRIAIRAARAEVTKKAGTKVPKERGSHWATMRPMVM